MPIKRAAFKAHRQNLKHRQRNLAIKTGLRKTVKLVRKEVTAKNTEKAKAALVRAIKTIDRAYSKTVIKRNTAARLKSRLTKAVQKLAGGQ